MKRKPENVPLMIAFASLIVITALALCACVPKSAQRLVEVPVETAKPGLPPAPAWAYEEPQYERTLQFLLFESVPPPTPNSDSAVPPSLRKPSDARSP